MLRMSQIYRMDSDFASEAAILERALERVDAQTVPGQNQVTVRYLLAQAYRDLHIPGLRDEDPEVVKASNEGLRKSAQLSEEIIKMLSPSEIAKYQSTPEETKLNQNYLEGSLFARAFCMSMLTLPEDKIPEFRRTAAQTYAEFIEQFPKSPFVPRALMQMGTLLVVLQDVSRANDAFNRLTRDFPDSEEARLALFSQAMALINMGFRQEGIEILRKMFNDPAPYTAAQMLKVGQELLQSKENDEAIRAFDIALQKEKDNKGVQMTATLGKADALINKRQYTEAVTLLEGFLRTFERSVATIDANLKLSHAASAAAVSIDNTAERIAMFNKAIDAMKMVRQYRTTPGEVAVTDNDIGRIYLRMAEAEKRLNNPDGERNFLSQAVGWFIPVLDNADTTRSDVRVHLEESYFIALPLMLKLGEYRDVQHYANAYLNLFPNGRHAADVRTWLNEANIKLRR